MDEIIRSAERACLNGGETEEIKEERLHIRINCNKPRCAVCLRGAIRYFNRAAEIFIEEATMNERGLSYGYVFDEQVESLRADVSFYEKFLQSLATGCI